MGILFIVFFAVVGALLGIVVGRAEDAGYFERWQPVAAPPAKITEFETSGGGTLYARSIAGETYRCTDWLGECWLRDEVPASTGDTYPTTVTKPCDLSAPEFALLTNPPKQIADCIQDETMYADGWMRNAYVLDREGGIWEWSHGSSVGTYTGRLCTIPVFGLATGSVIGITCSRLRRSRHDRNRETTS